MESAPPFRFLLLPGFDLAAVGAGLFLGNAVPHFVAGAMGEMFPSPFADPPGFGLSSPLTNMIWALSNLLIGYVLLRVGRVQPTHYGSMIALFIGVAAIGIMLSMHFGDVMGGAAQ